MIDKQGWDKEADHKRGQHPDKKTQFLLWLSRRLVLLIHYQTTDGRTLPASLWGQCVAIQRKILRILALRKTSGLREWAEFVDALERAHEKLFTPLFPENVVSFAWSTFLIY